MKPEEIARVAHEVNRAYSQAIGEYSHAPWDLAPIWQRESAFLGVAFHLANPDAAPADSHLAWVKQKEADGWRYGPIKDFAKKQHPCMVPFQDLPTEQRAKDYIFRAIVRALAHEIGA